MMTLTAILLTKRQTQSYDNFMEAKSTNETPRLSKEQEERWKEFIRRIRQNVPPPIPGTRNIKEVMDEIGPIHVDEDAVNDLRLISTL